jgi:hypothetical protein
METGDYLRSFGMSGFIVTEELKTIEQRFSVELGHLPRASQQSATEYYPQFEQAVRQEAAQMARHYEVFYCLEQAIRKLITEAMEETAGSNWWEDKIPQQIRDEVKKLIKAEVDSGLRAAPILQLTIRHLGSFR